MFLLYKSFYLFGFIPR